MTSSFWDAGSSIFVLSKAKPSFVAEPMVPLVDKTLVDLLEKSKTSVIPAPYVRFRHAMPTGSDTHRHPPQQLSTGPYRMCQGRRLLLDFVDVQEFDEWMKSRKQFARERSLPCPVGATDHDRFRHRQVR